MMSTLKTPFQYLLDLTGAARINAAKATGDKAAIAKAERFYLDLKESECEFTKPFKNVLAGNKWQTDVTVRTRGFKIPALRYNTGTLSPMIRPNANIMANKSSLDLSTVTGLYHVYETEADHLLVHPNSNIFEALKMTGYVFENSEYEITWFPARDENQKADGYVDIKHSVVSGRVYLSIVQKEVNKDNAPAPKDVAPVTPVQVKGVVEETSAPVAEGVKLEGDVVQSGETLAPVEGGVDAEDAAIQALLDADKKGDATVLAEGAADKTVAVQEAAKVVAPQEEAPAEEPAVEEAPAQQKKKK